MLMKRIIPCLDVHEGRVVKGVNFLNLRDAGDPVAVARVYDEAGADELVFLDITASHEGRDIMLDMVRRVAEQCFMPFTVGGGIRTIDDVTRLIQAGAEKVSINTAAVIDPDIVAQTARRFGRCATVVNIDPKRVPRKEFEARRRSLIADGTAATEGKDADRDYVFEVHTHGGRKPTGLDALEYARYVVELGAGEIILTSMDADGTKDGYDIEITGAVAEAVDVPVVASGGCGSPEHMRQVFEQTRADAALAASIFHYGEYPIGVTKQYLIDAGVPVRPAV
jgi:imidazole glycerol-phosphate synthase subunit HisF